MMRCLENGKKVIEQYALRGELPGACFAVVTPQETVIDCTGYRAIVPEKLPVRADTMYDLASLTKVIATTTMALRLIEDGYFTLDTKLCELLPDFPHPEVTIKHIMTHTSGICFDDKAYKDCMGKQQIWEFIKSKPLEYAPGTNLVYSDFGYVSLGFAIESIVGDLESYAKRTIFEPLQMRDTVYCPAEKGLSARCASTEQTADRGVICGEVHDGKAWRLGGHSGNAGLFSTAEDLARFVRMLLADGTLEGNGVLHASTVRLLKRCYTDGLPARRTLGWFFSEPTASCGDYYSETSLYHTGFTGTSVYIDFIRQCGIILLTNHIHPRRDGGKIIGIRNKFHNAVLLDFDEETQA